MSSSTRIARTISLALAVVATPVLADQFNWSLYGGVEHSDNINLVSAAPVSQWLLLPGFGFDYNKQGATLQAQVNGGAEYVDYLGGPYTNQKFGVLTGTVNWTVLPQRLDFVAQDYAGVQPVSTLSSDAPGNQQQTNVLMLGPTLHFNLGSAMRGEVDVRYINSRASRTTEFNSSRGEGALRLIRDMSPTSQLSFNAETQKIDFDSSNEVNYRRDNAFLRYVSKLARLDLHLAAGVSHISLAGGGGSVSSPLWRASVDWRANSRNMFGVSYTHNYSDAAQDLINLAEPAGSVLPAATTVPLGIQTQTGGVAIGSGIYLEQRLQANYGYSGDRLTVSLSPWYRKLHYVEANIQPDQTGHGVDAGVDYRLNLRLTLTGFANYEHESYTTLDRRDTTTNIGVALRQFINSHWSWRVSLINRRRTSTTPGVGYHANVIYAGVVYQR